MFQLKLVNALVTYSLQNDTAAFQHEGKYIQTNFIGSFTELAALLLCTVNDNSESVITVPFLFEKSSDTLYNMTVKIAVAAQDRFVLQNS